MQQTHQTMSGCHLLHDLHSQLVVVGGDVGSTVNRGKFMLGRGYLIMLRLGKDAELPQFPVQIRHILSHPGLDGAEIVIVHLLPFWRLCAKQRTAAEDQVLTLIEHGTVDQKVFLFRSNGGTDTFDILIAEQSDDPHRLLVQRLHGAQQRRLFIQRLSAVGAKGGGDAQRLILDERIGGGVPRRIAAGLKGRAQATGGEAGGIRLPLDQFLAGELHDYTAVR